MLKKIINWLSGRSKVDSERFEQKCYICGDTFDYASDDPDHKEPMKLLCDGHYHCKHHTEKEVADMFLEVTAPHLVNKPDEIAERWKDPSLCDICGGKCDDMTDENGHVGPYDYAITYCLHHRDEELKDLYRKIKRANDEWIYKLVDEVLASNDVDQYAMDKAKSVLAHMKYINTALRKK